MSQKKNSILKILIFFAIIMLLAGPVHSSIPASPPVTLYSLGTIEYNSSFTVIEANGIYLGKNNYNPSQTISSDSPTSVITSVFGWMTTGQIVEFIGNFSIDSMIPVTKGIILNFSRATIMVTATTAAFDIRSSNVSVFGGHWFGPGYENTNVQTAIRAFGYITNVLIHGCEFENFVAIGPGTGTIFAAIGTSYLTIENCVIHGGGGGQSKNVAIDLQGLGFNKVINCTMYNCSNGVFIADGTQKNQIINCTFQGISPSHSIYLDGGSTNLGENEIHGCLFSDQGYNAGLQIKCPGNKIYNNVFRDFARNGGTVCFSIYSQYNPSYANYNEIYNNSFIDIYHAFWISGGGNIDGYPTVGNKIYDNVFSNVTHCIGLNMVSSYNWVNGTWIYYNDFSFCENLIETYLTSPPNKVSDTVVAYNTISPNVTNLAFKTAFQNTMIYGNTGLVDYNVPTILPILPR